MKKFINVLFGYNVSKAKRKDIFVLSYFGASYAIAFASVLFGSFWVIVIASINAVNSYRVLLKNNIKIEE